MFSARRRLGPWARNAGAHRLEGGGDAEHADVVETAADGEAAIRMISEFIPDIVLLDVILPGQDGIEILPQLKALAQAARIIVMSGGGVRAVQPSFLYIYVPNVDDTFERAVAAGAKAVERPAEMPWGHRRAIIEDPWGNTWQAATARE